MNNTARGWIAVLAMLIVAGLVGVFAYNAGVSQGAAQGGTTVISAPAGAQPYYPYYPMYRPWGFGSYFIAFFFFLAILSAIRGIFGRHDWRRDGCGSRQGYLMEEWHRRMHERMGDDAPTGGTASR
jgi:hypothetical protein